MAEGAAPPLAPGSVGVLEPEPALSGAEQAADRAAGNTAVRAAAEIFAKLASLALVFVLARGQGAVGLGIYVFAIAWAEVANLPVDMGFDRFLIRQVARDRSRIDLLLPNVAAVKVLRAGPALLVSFALVNLLGYGAANREAVYAASAGVLLDSLAQSVLGVFTGLERGGLAAVVLVFQRVLAAVLGIAALAAGLGVVAVLIGFSIAAGAALLLSVGLLVARVGRPHVSLSRGTRREIRSGTLGFAAQEVFASGIARADTLLLSLMATTAAVGLYGAGYRLLESTLFIPLALTTAFAAMFTYLEVDSDPPVRAVYGRALKVALVALVPCATAMLVLAEPILRLLFGEDLVAAAGPVRLLAPVVVLLGVVILSTSLLVSRRDPKVIMWAFLAALVVNLVANLTLIPLLDVSGAALAMLLTEGMLAVVTFHLASRTVGRPPLLAILGAPLAAGTAMAVPMALLSGTLVLALIAGALAYVAVLVAVERVLSPDDLRFAMDMARRRLPGRRDAAG